MIPQAMSNVSSPNTRAITQRRPMRRRGPPGPPPGPAALPRVGGIPPALITRPAAGVAPAATPAAPTAAILPVLRCRVGGLVVGTCGWAVGTGAIAGRGRLPVVPLREGGSWMIFGLGAL